MNFRIAIPSCSRANTLLNKTIAYLLKTNIDLSKVDVFLSKNEELEEYKIKLKDYPVNLIVANNTSINEQRNFMVRYYPVGQNVMGIDDDIQSIESKINDKKTQTLLDLKELGNQAFDLCLKNKVNLWGINASFNPFFMKHNISFNLKFIIACFYGWVNNHEDKAFVLEKRFHTKEDYERTIKYYKADNGVLRFNYLAPKTKIYTEKGGIQLYRTPESEKESVEYMLKTYPMFCKINNARKGKFSQIRLTDQRKKIK
jgi:hypothetical protein